MTKFTDALRATSLVADGAMGTMLQQRGLPLNEPSAAWSLSHASEVLAVHRLFVSAGCDIVLTNSISANTKTFSTEQATAINLAAASIARKSGAKWVAGSMGPGADEAQARALAEGGVDLFWLETQLTLADVTRAIGACRRASPEMPIVVSYSFHLSIPETLDGAIPAVIADSLADYDIAAIGMNCGHGMLHAEHVLSEFSTHASVSLVFKPNAGLPATDGDGVTYPLAPESWAAQMRALVSPRVGIVGGCCGTTPAHIAALLDVVVAST